MAKFPNESQTMYGVALFIVAISQITNGQHSDGQRNEPGYHNETERKEPGYRNQTEHDFQYHSGSDQGNHSFFNGSQHGGHQTERIQKHNELNVTCPELDWTFSNSPPFDHLELPHCGDVIKPILTLYGPSNQCELDPAYLPNNITDECITDIIHSNNIKNVIIISHGFLKSFSASWMHDMSDYLIQNDNSTAVLVVGWGHGSGGLPVPDPLLYWQAAANTRYMGVMVKKVVVTMVELGMTVTNRLDSGPSFHCIGHSLGAHICAFVGKGLASDPSAFFSLRRISGLDPAGPLFADDVPYPFNMKIDSSARLDPSDADLVDVIHTDGKARFPRMIVPQYGTMMKLGHIDFYPGNNHEYGWNQPGCWEVMDIGACSHSRAHDLYLSSMTSPCQAFMRCTDTINIPDSCHNITAGTAPLMGYWLNFTKNMLEEPTKPLERTKKFNLTKDKSPLRNVATERALAGDSWFNGTGRKPKRTKRTTLDPEKLNQNTTEKSIQRIMAWMQKNKIRKLQKHDFISSINTTQKQKMLHYSNNPRDNTVSYKPLDKVKSLQRISIPRKMLKMYQKYDKQTRVKLNNNIAKSIQNKKITLSKDDLMQQRKKTSGKQLYLVVEDVKKAPFCNKNY